VETAPLSSHMELAAERVVTCRKKKTRTVFSRAQILQLESTFDAKRYLSSAERSSLASALRLTETQVYRDHCYFASGMGEKYCDQCVCVFVCLLVFVCFFLCLHAYLKNHSPNFTKFFCKCSLTTTNTTVLT